MGDPFLSAILPLVLVFGIMYFLIIRPQQQRMKRHREMIEAVRRGDQVITSGGILGKVTKVLEGDEIMVEIADGVRIRVVKSTLMEVRAKGAPVAVEKPAKGRERTRDEAEDDEPAETPANDAGGERRD